MGSLYEFEVKSELSLERLNAGDGDPWRVGSSRWTGAGARPAHSKPDPQWAGVPRSARVFSQLVTLLGSVPASAWPAPTASRRYPQPLENFWL
jgi:hypothetical protein